MQSNLLATLKSHYPIGEKKKKAMLFIWSEYYVEETG